MNYRRNICTLIVAFGIFGVFGLRAAEAAPGDQGEPCINTNDCSTGVICSYETGPEFRTCQALSLSIASTSVTATAVSSVVQQNGISSMQVYGCLGTQATCAAQPFTNTQYWTPLASNNGNVTAAYSGLRSGRTYQVVFGAVAHGSNAYVSTGLVTTLPNTTITPTVSDITDTTARITWSSGFSGNSIVKYGSGPLRWQSEAIPTTPITDFSDISAAPDGSALAIGQGRVVRRSDNSLPTHTWQDKQSGIPATTLYAVDMFDQNNAVIGAGAGVVFRTTDGGTSWTSSQIPGSTADVFDVIMPTSQTAWAAGRGSMIAFFDGSSWGVKRSGGSINWYSIFSLTNTQVWAGGSSSSILYSQDRGATWTGPFSLPGAAGEAINSIASLDGLTLWAGGDNGKLWKGVNGGKTVSDWTLINSGTSGSISDLSPLSATEVWFSDNTRIGKNINGTTQFSSDASAEVGAIRGLDVVHPGQAIIVGTQLRAAEYTAVGSAKVGLTSQANHAVVLDGMAPNTDYSFAYWTFDPVLRITNGGTGSLTTTAPDFIDPQLTITQPSPSPAYVNFANRIFQIRGSITDNQRLGTMECRDDTNRFPFGPVSLVTPTLPISNPAGVSATWYHQVALGPVEQTYNYTCEVSDGTNRASTAVSMIYDNTPPSLTVTTPDPFATNSGTPLTATGTVTDENGFSSMTYTLNGAAAQTVATPSGTGGAFSFPLTGVIAGDNDLTVTATDKAGNPSTTTFTFFYEAPAYTLSLSPATQTAAAGTAVVYTARVTPIGGFTGSVSLALTGQPSGATVAFQQNPVVIGATPVDVPVTITTQLLPTGTFTLSLTSATLPVTAPATATLILTAPPDFTLTSTPGSRSVTAGGNTNYTINIAANPTYAGTVGNLSVQISPLSVAPCNTFPTGVTSGFAPGNVTLGNSQSLTTSLTINTTAATPGCTYVLRVSGTDVAKAITRFVDITFVVTQPPDVSLSVVPASASVQAGSVTAANYNGKAIAINGYNLSSNITASVGSTINGLSISISPNSLVPAAGPTGSDFVVSVTADSRVPGGTYTLSITLAADNGSLRKTVQVQLVVTGDTTAPVISITQADVNPNYDRAAVAWRTNEAANTRLEVYADAARTTLVGFDFKPGYVLNHSTSYIGLQPTTTYYLKVISADEAAAPNTASTIVYDDGTDLTFRTLDAPDFTPPTILFTQPTDGATVIGTVSITGVATDNKAVSTVVVTILRPDGSQAFSQTFTAGAPSYTFSLNWDSLVGRINGLYTFKALATDTAGNPSPEAVMSINVQNDLTRPDVADGYPQAVNLTCGAPTYTDPNLCSITILWFTDDASTSRVEYAPENEYFFGNSSATPATPPGYQVMVDRDDADPALSPTAPIYTEHRVTLTNLARQELYHYRVWSCNISGDCTNN